MRQMSIREANQNFSRVIALAEAGETIVITKQGKPVATISPEIPDRRQDPEYQAAHARLVASLRDKPATGFRVGTITEDDLYGEDPGPILPPPV